MSGTSTFCFFTHVNTTVSQQSLWIASIVSMQLKGAQTTHASQLNSRNQRSISERTHTPKRPCFELILYCQFINPKTSDSQTEMQGNLMLKVFESLGSNRCLWTLKNIERRVLFCKNMWKKGYQKVEQVSAGWPVEPHWLLPESGSGHLGSSSKQWLSCGNGTTP